MQPMVLCFGGSLRGSAMEWVEGAVHQGDGGLEEVAVPGVEWGEGICQRAPLPPPWLPSQTSLCAATHPDFLVVAPAGRRDPAALQHPVQGVQGEHRLAAPHPQVELVLGELLLPDVAGGRAVTRPPEHLHPRHLLHLEKYFG